MRHSLTETLLGAFVIITAIIIAAYAVITNNDPTRQYYNISAQFGRVDGIVTGSDVRLGGVKIGRVSGAALDEVSFSSVLNLAIDEAIKLPRETTAAIASEGVLGKNFVRLSVPPSALPTEDYLQNGDAIKKTTDAVSLEDLLGRALFLIGETR